MMDAKHKIQKHARTWAWVLGIEKKSCFGFELKEGSEEVLSFC